MSEKKTTKSSTKESAFAPITLFTESGLNISPPMRERNETDKQYSTKFEKWRKGILTQMKKAKKQLDKFIENEEKHFGIAKAS